MTSDRHIVVIGSANIDLVLSVAKLPRPGETVMSSAVQLLPGGKGLNQAVALGRLGSAVSLLGCVGTDENADLVRTTLKNANADPSGVITSLGPTGQAVVLVEDGGENCIVVHAGANEHFTVEQLMTAKDILLRAAAVLIQCEVPATTVAAAVSTATGLVVLNPAPAHNLPLSALDGVNVLVPNLGELETLAGSELRSFDAIISAARSLPVPRVVVTLGARGALWLEGGRLGTIPPPPVDVVDTTGAGDCFCAALTSRLVAGDDLEGATRFAVHAGALSTTARGAQGGLPTTPEVFDSLAES